MLCMIHLMQEKRKYFKGGHVDEPAQQHPPMNGDDELAKALGGGLQFEETPVAGAAPVTDANQDAALASLATPAITAPSLTAAPAAVSDSSMPTVHHDHDILADEPTLPAAAPSAKPTAKPVAPPNERPATELDKLKASALDELRPLVGKLNLAPEDKFDTLLLIIRSTDDHALLDEAHETAKKITDDARRAQALLDIIKEVDYFSAQK